jgi:hypothetical protein
MHDSESTILRAPCCKRTPLLMQYLHALYCITVTQPEPMPFEARQAMYTLHHAFRWLCPYPLDSDQESMFVATGELHELCDPATFNGDEIVERYTNYSISTDTWGPTMWTLLHRLAEYSDSVGDAYTVPAVLVALTVLLPCPVCRDHLAEMLQQQPAPQHNMAKYVSDLHNIVNRRLGKPVWPAPPQKNTRFM